MRNLKQSTAANVMVLMVDEDDHVMGLAGLTLTITASKDGAAFASISPTVTDRGDGWYNLALTTSHTDTLGDLAIHITATGADPSDLICRVVAVDLADSVRFGLTALPNAAAEAAGGLYTRGTGAGQINQDGNGRIDVNAVRWAGTATTLTSGLPDVNTKTITNGIISSSTFAASALDAVWSTGTRTLTAGTNIVLAKGVGVTGFNDLDAAGVRGAVGLASANLDTQLDAIPTASENADAVWDEPLAGHLSAGSTGEALDGAGGGGGPSAADIADAVWDEATAGHTGAGSFGKLVNDNVDTTISSRLSAAGYTAPDNSTISTINTKIGTPAVTVSTDIAAVSTNVGIIKTIVNVIKSMVS